VALAWLLGRRPWIVPIPGTKRPKYIEDNVGAPDVELSAADEERLASLAASVEGARYESEARTPTWVSPPLAS
jgi:aryl-alcohol dehydrogenase-like predicted oxidoreductase